MELERWKRLGIRKQLGHITSEIVRAEAWFDKSDEKAFQASIDRALDLIDLTSACEINGRRREILRMREVVSGTRSLHDDHVSQIKDISKYLQAHFA